MITKAQQRAILAKYRQSADGSTSYLNFRRRWVLNGFAGDTWIACHNWCGMYIGIEKCGYTHS